MGRPRSAVLGSTVLLLGLTCAGVLPAQPCCSGPSLPPGFSPQPISPATPQGWQSAAELARDAGSAWAAVEARGRPGWRVMIHPVYGTPTWILTPGLDVGMAPLDGGAASVRVARRLVERYRDILGVDDLSALKLSRVSLSPNPHGQTVLGVNFKQTYRGYDVRSPSERLRVKLCFNATLGALSVMGSDWLAHLRCAVSDPLPREVAIERARAEIPPYAPGHGAVRGVETYVLVEPDPRAEIGLAARLVHHVRFAIDNPPDAWSVILDARRGTLVRKHRDVVYTDVIGNVAAGSWDDSPRGSFTVVPMRSLYVSIVGGATGTTDAQGNFKIPHPGTQPVTITGRFAGDWCTVQNKAGTNTSFSAPATPGQAANVVMNPQHVSELTTAEATAYRFATATRFLCAKRIPRFTGLQKLTTNVNLANVCNAYYSNNSINFFKSGGTPPRQCPNTAYEEVVAHEYGHAFHVWFHGSFQPLDFSEGIGDHLGLYVSGQRVIGRDFFGPGKPVRDYTQPVSQPMGAKDRRLNDPACNREPHCLGEAWAGFTIDLRDLLIAKHGPVQGVAVAEVDTLAQYDRNPTDITAAVLQTFVQDDNDNNLQNGTPNFKQIAQAADLHGIPRPPDPPTVEFEHTPFSDTRDTVNNYPISAKVISKAGTVTGAWLVYKVGSGSFTSIVMTRGPGNIWSGAIPAQKAVARVSYYLEGTDDKNNRERFPDPGTLDFTVGRLRTFFADDFETDKGWQVASTATSGRFERADPIRSTYTGNKFGDCQPEDDHTPGGGVTCYVTENGLRGREAYLFDVDNGYTEIRSPSFDLSSVVAGAARLRYARWFFTNKNDDSLDVDISTDNGQTWKSLERVAQRANRWTPVEMGLAVPYTSRMKVRFRTADDPNNSVTDALVDDVSIVVFDDDVAELRGTTRAPAIGTTLGLTLGAARRASAGWWFAISFTPGPTVIPGLGTTDLGVPFYILAAGRLGSSGRAQFGIPVPADPRLKGLKVYTEALVFATDGIFSNPWNIQIQ